LVHIDQLPQRCGGLLDVRVLGRGVDTPGVALLQIGDKGWQGLLGLVGTKKSTSSNAACSLVKSGPPATTLTPALLQRAMIWRADSLCTVIALMKA
jgi:hypothetical protein